MRCVLLCMVEVMEGVLCLREVPKVPEAMRCVLPCMVEAVDGGTVCWRYRR